jgi:splicing factor 3A subunit 2
MDFQNRVGGKTGGGGVASWSESNRDRRERLRQLALETIDLNKDPYFMKNHLGILNKHTIVNKTFYFYLV